MGRARYNTGLFPLPDNVLPVQLFGGTSEGSGVCDAQALPPETQSGHPKPKKCLPTKQQQKNSTHTASLTVTHPLIPSQEGKQIHSNLSFPNRKAASKSPRPKEGQGVCDAQALPLKSKAVTEAD